MISVLMINKTDMQDSNSQNVIKEYTFKTNEAKSNYDFDWGFRPITTAQFTDTVHENITFYMCKNQLSSGLLKADALVVSVDLSAFIEMEE